MTERELPSNVNAGDQLDQLMRDLGLPTDAKFDFLDALGEVTTPEEHLEMWTDDRKTAPDFSEIPSSNPDADPEGLI